jgi:predicted outer membrane repeat protein
MTQQLQQLLILAALLIGTSALVQAQIYVNAGASGNNDGTTWADAYTDLNDALESATSGDQVWVAAGTYVPGSNPDSSFFNLSDGVELYGGFDGSEASVDDRDVAANVTILSGDVNGDDAVGDFDNNRTDNIATVVYADTTITAATRIDGFTISGGHGLFEDDVDQLFISSGAAILAQGPLQIHNCTITDNRSGRGGGLSYRTGDITGFRVQNTTVDGNLARTGGGVYLAGGSAGTFEDCTFSNNTVEPAVDMDGNLVGGFGAGVLQISVIDTFLNCTFTGNSNLQRVGGGIFTQDAFPYIEGCTFSDNEANDGGGIYITSVDEEVEALIANSTFTNNFAGRLGGAVTVAGGTIGWDNCTFEDNEGPSGGGAFFFFQEVTNVIQNSTFNRNISDFGGVMRSQGDESVWINNTYEANVGNSAGGALCFTFESSGEVIGGTFFGNNSPFGGAVFSGFGTLPVVVSLEQVRFEENIASSSGGAIQAQNISQLTVDSCSFEFNSSEALGGAINASGDTLDNGFTVIEKSSFLGNIGNQGAAVNNINNRMDITNSLFAYNETSENGIGGGFSENMAVDGPPQAVNLMNNTFAFNTAETGANVSQWQTPEAPEVLSVMNMQNNILAEGIGGPNYQIEVAGIEPELNSTGGNLLTDASLGSAAVAEDMVDVDINDIAFVSGFQFELTEESVAVNAGVNDGAPLVDITGATRLTADNTVVDPGAFEYPFTNSVENLAHFDIEMAAYPTVTNDQVTLTFSNDKVGKVRVLVFNQKGQLVMEKSETKGAEQFKRVYNVGSLGAGLYFVRTITGKGVAGGKFMVIE